MNVLQMVEKMQRRDQWSAYGISRANGFNLKQVLHSELFGGPLLVSAFDCLRIPQSEVEEPQKKRLKKE